MSEINAVRAALRAKIDHQPRVFKAGPGEYAEHDKFLGISVPSVRLVAKQFADIAFSDIAQLLASEWHDERLCALVVLVGRYKRGSEVERQVIYEFYMAHLADVDNWDLVDSSAEFIVGPYLENRPDKMRVLQKLAASTDLWERRIAMLATFDYIKKGRAGEALAIAEQLLYDQHDLIQKAVGWMLREIGKRVGRQSLLTFLDNYAATMPRTTLRYAIEHLDPESRRYYMGLKGVK